MPGRMVESLAVTEPLAELFSDQSVLQAMLDFEVALARAEARVGVIPGTSVEPIAAAAKARDYDTASLASAIFVAGAPGIAVVKALTEKVRSRDAQAAGYVHWGATSQDVADTALVLLLKRAEKLLLEDLLRIEAGLRRLSEDHKNTVMLGRTLMQAAPPVTFGLKAAGWLGAVSRGVNQLRSAFANALLLQFGGASGTLASLGDQGVAVAVALAQELGLTNPEAPWHSQRDRLATLMCACGVVIGSLGKMARDIELLMQTEVAEAAEPGREGRGGSSTMPHKQNPTACILTLATAVRVPGLVASFLSAMVQEHERAAGGWQAEWPVVVSIIQSTGTAAASMAETVEGLSVDAERMRANLANTKGSVFAERAMILLGPKLGRDVARRVLEEASRRSFAENRHLAEVLAEMKEVTSHIDASTLRGLEKPEEYLGSAEKFRQALLSTAQPIKKEH